QTLPAVNHKVRNRFFRAKSENMEGAAFVFINFIQAGRMGHVGWGFLIDPATQTYYFGSTDHLWRHNWWDLVAWIRYTHVNPSANNDWWSGTGTHDDMLRMMSGGHHIRYHAAKRVSV